MFATKSIKSLHCFFRNKILRATMTTNPLMKENVIKKLKIFKLDFEFWMPENFCATYVRGPHIYEVLLVVLIINCTKTSIKGIETLKFETCCMYV